MVQDPPRPRRPTVRRSPARSVALPRAREPRWLTPGALAIAVVLHLVAVAVLSREVHYTLPVADDVRILLLPTASEAEPPRLAEVTEIPAGIDAPSPAAVTPPLAAPTPRAAPTRVPPIAETRTAVAGEIRDTTGVSGAGVAGTGTRDPGSLLDRVRPRATDPRLWGPIPEPPSEGRRVDAFTSALAPLYAQFDAYNDSTRAAAEAAAKATDWTATDASGGRWGISPEGIHLGKVTLPIPIGFSAPPGRRDELSGRINGWSAIRRQQGEAEVRESFEDRVKAIRERNAAKRDSSRTGKD
jgi:hypothetical protein